MVKVISSLGSAPLIVSPPKDGFWDSVSSLSSSSVTQEKLQGRVETRECFWPK